MITDLLAFLAANQHALWQRTVEHLELMFFSLLAATAVGVPAGAVAARVPQLALVLVAAANLIQTIPSVALLGFLLPVMGIGSATASVALFLYALLPIVRNTVTGLQGVERGVVDAAVGMGMTRRQVLVGIEFPLALPVFFAGIRTAAVINVGVTTLSALVGAGGLGTFIFRGLATNNTATILLGAIPSAILALLADSLLAGCERMMHRPAARWMLVLVVVAIAATILGWRHLPAQPPAGTLRFGFTSEFMERPDGFEAWRRHYALPPLAGRELDPGLLYSALDTCGVDVACGFSTDGRIAAFGLRPLDDDRNFFPDYAAALLVRNATLERHPGLPALLNKLTGSLDEPMMRALNRRVDMEGLTPARAASDFLEKWAPAHGVAWDAGQSRRKGAASDRPDLVIGTKNFTEQYVLGQIVCQLINGATGLQAGLKQGLGGTAICFGALKRGDIDFYPEYSGTLLTSVVSPPPDLLGELVRNPVAAEKFLRGQLASRYDLMWLPPLGFNNTYAILVREKDPRFSGVQTISDLRQLLPRMPEKNLRGETGLDAAPRE